MSSAAARRESDASAGSVDDSGVEDAGESLHHLDVSGGSTGVASGASTPAAKRRRRKKKKRAASNASAGVGEEEARAETEAEAGGEAAGGQAAEEAAAAAAAQESEPAAGGDEEEASALAPPVPASPASPVSEADYMHTLSGKKILMHREVWGHWSMSDYAAIKVRSLDYTRTGVKIPPPCPPTMEIKQLEIYMCDKQIFHVCQYKDNWLRQLKARQGVTAPAASAAAPASSSSSAAPTSPSSPASPPDLSSGAGLRPFDPDFWFVVTFHVQTNPTFHLTMYFQRRGVHKQAQKGKGGKAAASPMSPSSPVSPQPGDDEEAHEPRAAAAAKRSFDTLFRRFVEGDTQFRNTRLKLIPFVVDGGNWFVTKAVGNRPAIIGKAITTKYYCDPKLNYMEVNIDVSGSRLGSGIFRVVKGYASYLTLDLTLLIEGQELDELPEVILGGCRLRKVDLSKPEVRPPPDEEEDDEGDEEA